MLYVVATPIGNMRDITLRAMDVLEEVDEWVVEDSRRAGKLREQLELPKKPMNRYYDENEQKQTPELLEKLETGIDMALICDAGTPVISDPGYTLIKQAREEGIPVHPVPGVSAPITALSVSGFPSDQFLFAGFMPRSQKKRRDELLKIKHKPFTVIYFEAPHRIEQTLTAIRTFLGQRQLFLGREMTKKHEEYTQATAEDLLSEIDSDDPRGEFTIMVHPYEGTEVDPGEYLRELLERGMSLSDAARIAASYSEDPKSKLYQAGLDIQDEMSDSQ